MGTLNNFALGVVCTPVSKIDTGLQHGFVFNYRHLILLLFPNYRPLLVHVIRIYLKSRIQPRMDSGMCDTHVQLCGASSTQTILGETSSCILFILILQCQSMSNDGIQGHAKTDFSDEINHMPYRICKWKWDPVNKGSVVTTWAFLARLRGSECSAKWNIWILGKWLEIFLRVATYSTFPTRRVQAKSKSFKNVRQVIPTLLWPRLLVAGCKTACFSQIFLDDISWLIW